jgi:hypothetical protein
MAGHVHVSRCVIAVTVASGHTGGHTSIPRRNVQSLSHGVQLVPEQVAVTVQRHARAGVAEHLRSGCGGHTPRRRP